MLRVGVIDYGAGNQKNIFRAIKAIHCQPALVRNPNDLENIDHIIIPGMGHYTTAVKNLKKTGLFDALKKAHKLNKKIFGICLGLQLMVSSGDEGGDSEGLNFLEGKTIELIKYFNFNKGFKIPIIGWFKINWKNNNSNSFIEKDSLLINSEMYLAHSYGVFLDDENISVASYDYFGKKITAAIRKDNLFGTQFHPEKSGENGLKILRAFVE